MAEVNHHLLKLFRSHGVEADLDGEWVVFPGLPYRANTEVFERTAHGKLRNIQLDVRLELGPHCTIVESSTGLGETIEAGAEDGFATFVRQTFHVLLAAFFKTGPDEQVTREVWTVGGRQAEATIGNFATRGPSPFIVDQYQTLMADYRRLIEKQELAPGFHWARFYYGHMDHKPMVFEALLDNDAWEPVKTEMAALPWPKQAAFYSVRLFLVVKVERGGSVSPETAMRWFANLVAPREQVLVDEVHQQVVDMGVPAALADRTYNFAQIAAGRQLLASLGVQFSPDYCYFDKHGEVVETGVIAKEPSFVAGKQLMPTYLGTPGFKHLAMCSADVNVVNQALNAGSKPENLELGPAFLFREVPTDEGALKAQQTMNNMMKSSATTPVKKTKSSWKFWR